MSTDPFVSYAQNHEDVVLARALHPDRETGFWIDIGAGDPVAESVTAAFSERGWHGINVEPLRREYELLCAARPGDINLCLAIGAAPGTATLFQGPDTDRGGSTLRSDIVESHGVDADSFTPVEVEVRTLADLVSEYVTGPVDFLKIDVEGLEHDVIAGADFTRFRPRVLVVEATFPNTTKPSHESWEPMLLDAGYQFAMFDGLNRFYALADEPDLIQALSIPANVFDTYVPHRWILEFAKASSYADDLQSQAIALREELTLTQEAFQRALGDAATGWKAARYAEDRTRVVAERATVLHDELGAAQVRVAQALAEGVFAQQRVDAAEQFVVDARGDVERAEADLAAARDELRGADERIAMVESEVARQRFEIAAIHATRTFRYTARVRAVYTKFRRALRL